MPEIVADTGPLRYLVLIEAVDVLPRFFERVLIPETVGGELRHPSAPPLVSEWLATRPAWLEMRTDLPALDILPARLGAGERAAIRLAQALRYPLLLIDDRTGIEAARARGIEATRTLGVLVRAARLGLVDLRTAFTRLRATNFRYRRELLDDLLARHNARTP